VLETFTDRDGAPLAALVRLRLETGRTHQIRVHLTHIGHPLLGDPVYGRGFLTRAARLQPQAQAALQVLDRQALHAAELGFEHPTSGKSLEFQSALPEDLQGLVSALRGQQPARRGKSAKLKAGG
jgi:23S rRNA pseudouridine1911/1915/1917 synthase